MTIRFDQPTLLYALVLVLPLAAAGWAWMRGMSPLRRSVSILVRTGLVAVLVAMLAGASSVRTTDRLAVVVVIDVSESVRTFAPIQPLLPAAPGDTAPPTSVPAALRAWVERAAGGPGRRTDDLLGIVAFDGAASIVSPPRPPSPAREAAFVNDDPLDRPLPAGLTDGTDIAAALRLAQASFPPDARRRIVLLSDGNQTSGDALAAALAGSASGTGRGSPVPVDVVPLRYRAERATVIESVDAPARLPGGTSATVRVALRSAGPATGILRLTADGREVPIGSAPGGGLALTLAPGRRVEVLSAPVGTGRVHRFGATFEPDPPANGEPPTLVVNSGAQAVSVSPANGAVLLVDGVDGGTPGTPGETLARTLRQAGMSVDVVAPEALPADMLQLQTYDLVILQNVAAHSVGVDGVERLARFTTDLGGGLIVIGGPDTLAGGGYRGSALEAVLPVRLELPEKLVLPAAAVVFVMDCSGSMGWSVGGTGRTQQAVANEGAALAARSLDPGDLVGVIAFSGSYREVVPLSRNKDPEATANAILAIEPGGGTNLPPALAEAGRKLAAAEAKVKHIIVLSDGQSQGRERLRGMAAGLSGQGIKVSTIAVGDGADADGLADVATAGGGAFYRVTDPRVLPRVFLRAVQIVRAPLVREEPFEPVVVDEGDGYVRALREGAGEGNPAPGAALPRLLGLALTAPRDDKTVVNPIVSPQGEPVLAHWQAGLGRVAVFTSDAHKWAEPWIDWPGYRAFWTALARGTSRQAAERFADASARVADGMLALKVEAVDRAGKPQSGLVLTANVFTPAGERSEVRLAQTGPGVYEATSTAAAPGTYVATITHRAGPDTAPGAPLIAPMIAAATRSSGDEFRSFTSDDDLLGRLAAATAGRVLDPATLAPGDLFDRRGLEPRETRLPLWPALLPWALLALLFDVAARRVAWDRLLDPGENAALARALHGRSAKARATLSTLRNAGDRTDERLDSAATALSDADADTLAHAQAQRRRETRRRELLTQPPRDPEPPATLPAPPAPAEPDDQPGGLLAAKRRARVRFDEEAAG